MCVCEGGVAGLKSVCVCVHGPNSLCEYDLNGLCGGYCRRKRREREKEKVCVSVCVCVCVCVVGLNSVWCECTCTGQMQTHTHILWVLTHATQPTLAF